MSSLEYLEEERKKIWSRINQLESDLKKKTSDYEKEASNASRKASEYRNRCKGSHELASQHSQEIKNKLDEALNIVEDLNRNQSYSAEKRKDVDIILESSEDKLNEIEDLKETMISNVNQLDELFENHPELNDEIENLEINIANSEDFKTKIESIYKNAKIKKEEIDSLYYEINGYTDIDEETEEDTSTEGLKHKLENSYNDLVSKLKVLNTNFESFQSEKDSIFDSLISEKKDFFEQKSQEWHNGYDSIKKKIESLLPNAMTTGLSYAYSEKCEKEKKEQKKLKIGFYIGIFGLVVISLIPFCISYKSLIDGIPLEEVIIRTPRLVLAILPIYIPVMWVAYSANKKHNLSKRLMEEYAHKEALSKTFEGLSKQINDIEDSKTSSELHSRLLYNILEVSSENPGKLISDYNKSDHPLMDALDKSVKLTNAVNKLSNIPGLSKLSNIIDKKAEKLQDKQTEMIEKGLETIDKAEEN